MKIQTQCDLTSEEYTENYKYQHGLSEELSLRKSKAALGGGEDAIERLRGRGKLPARERINKLIDEGSYFMELSALAGFGLYDDDVPAAGIITGIGIVHGRPVMIVARGRGVSWGFRDVIVCGGGGLWRSLSCFAL